MHSYWMDRNTSLLPSIGVISGTPLDGDTFVQITSMNFGYSVSKKSARTFYPKQFYGKCLRSINRAVLIFFDLRDFCIRLMKYRMWLVAFILRRRIITKL